jgi:tripartite-type tricarboxylate transporter receptor subunit TctC
MTEVSSGVRSAASTSLNGCARSESERASRNGASLPLPHATPQGRRRFGRLIIATTAVVATIVMIRPSVAEDFYKGKRLNIVVGYTPGGGYDLNSRLLARHIGRHIPGNPVVVVTNMPGAAGLTSIQYLNNTAPKDGTVILHFNFGFITESRLNPDRIKLDFTKLNWIGSISQDLAVCLLWRGLGINTIEQARAHKELHFGLTATGSSSDVNAKIAKNIFKLPIHQVSGYPGSAEQRLAIERGELDGQCNPWSSTPPEWIREKKIYSIMRFTPATAPDLPREVPYAFDIAPTPQDGQVIKLLTAAAELGRPFVAALDVPEDRLKILRAAFVATMNDPEFKADAANGRMDVSPKNAEEALAIVKDIYNRPENIVDAAREILKN